MPKAGQPSLAAICCPMLPRPISPSAWPRRLWETLVASVWHAVNSSRASPSEAAAAGGAGAAAPPMHQGRCRNVDITMATEKSATASAAARPELQYMMPRDAGDASLSVSAKRTARGTRAPRTCGKDDDALIDRY